MYAATIGDGQTSLISGKAVDCKSVAMQLACQINRNNVTERLDALQIDWVAVPSTDAATRRRHRCPATIHAIIVSVSPAKSSASGNSAETFRSDVNLWLSRKPAIHHSMFAVSYISSF